MDVQVYVQVHVQVHVQVDAPFMRRITMSCCTNLISAPDIT
jgi:hypothetical protein